MQSKNINIHNNITHTGKIIRNDEALFLFSFAKKPANLRKKYDMPILFFSKNKQTKKFKTNFIYLYVVADRAFKINLHLPSEFFYLEKKLILIVQIYDMSINWTLKE